MARAVDWRPGMANVGTVRSGERQFSVIVISDDQQPATAAELADVFGELGKLVDEALRRQRAQQAVEEAQRLAAERAEAQAAEEERKAEQRAKRAARRKKKAEASA